MFIPRESWQLDTARIGRRVLQFDVVDSTNTRAFAMVETDPNSDGQVLIAAEQLAGRGQYGRPWHSAPGQSLLMSVILQPPPELRRPVILTAWAAVSVAESIYALTGTQARIKWPNDLLISGRKVCGILIEQSGNPSGAVTTVVGIGLNLTQTREGLAAANLPEATSLAIATGKVVDAQAAATVVIRTLDAEYARLLAGEQLAVEADWKWRIGLLGRSVIIEHLDGGTTTGRLREMGFDRLEVETTPGVMRAVAPETVAHILAASPGGSD